MSETPQTAENARSLEQRVMDQIGTRFDRHAAKVRNGYGQLLGYQIDGDDWRSIRSEVQRMVRVHATPTEVQCPTCIHPEGYDRLSGPCPTCNGEGAIESFRPEGGAS